MPTRWIHGKNAAARSTRFRAARACSLVLATAAGCSPPLTAGVSGLGVGEDDVAVLVEAESRVVGHFPGMTVEVAERSRVAAVEGLRRLASDIRSVRAGLLDDLVHFI